MRLLKEKFAVKWFVFHVTELYEVYVFARDLIVITDIHSLYNLSGEFALITCQMKSTTPKIR
jgi:hypothetical protein